MEKRTMGLETGCRPGAQERGGEPFSKSLRAGEMEKGSAAANETKNAKVNAEGALAVSGTTRVCGILADPVEHSMSPMLQNLYAERTGADLIYVPFRVEESRVEEAVRGAFALNLLGLNVTVPHKQRVMKYLDGVDETAGAVGAVNTLVRTERGYKGYNTDVPGLLRAVREAGMTVKGRKCILLGAGGAAKAAAYMLVSEGAEQIFLLNRSIEKACELADYINRLAGRELAAPLSVSEWRRIPKGRYLAIQSTSVGMYPKTDAAPVEERGFYDLIEEAVDVIYTPAETKFMRLVREAGGRAVNGLNMLLYQGVLSYELWNPGVKVDDETIGLAKRMIEKRLPGGGETVPCPSEGKSIILIGFMGAGKTSVGRELSARLGLPFIDTDQEIERRAGMSVPEIFEKQGEEGFRAMETETLRQLTEERGDSEQTGGERRPAVVSAGGGLPLREENRRLLLKLGTAVYLKTSPDEVVSRLEGDTSRPLLKGDSGRERVESLLSIREPLYEAAAARTVATDGKTPAQLAEEIIRTVIDHRFL